MVKLGGRRYSELLNKYYQFFQCKIKIMKAIRLILLVSFFSMFSQGYLLAQKSTKDFKGIIKYNITYPDSQFDDATMAMLPQSMTLKIMGSKKKMELFAGMANQVEITDAEFMSRIALIDVMGQKFAISYNKQMVEEELNKDEEPTVNYLDDTKTIVGYICKKAEVTSYADGIEQTIVVYYTDELGIEDISFEGEFRNLNGFPLEYTIKNDKIVMTFTASEIKEGGVKKKDFEVPDGYKYVTEEELKSMFGG